MKRSGPSSKKCSSRLMPKKATCFTQSLETLAYDLDKDDLASFDSNADKFQERMERSEFSTFLDHREANMRDSSFKNEISIALAEMDTFRREQKSAADTERRNKDFANFADCKRPPSLFCFYPVRIHCAGTSENAGLAAADGNFRSKDQ